MKLLNLNRQIWTWRSSQDWDKDETEMRNVSDYRLIVMAYILKSSSTSVSSCTSKNFQVNCSHRFVSHLSWIILEWSQYMSFVNRNAVTTMNEILNSPVPVSTAVSQLTCSMSSLKTSYLLVVKGVPTVIPNYIRWTWKLGSRLIWVRWFQICYQFCSRAPHSRVRTMSAKYGFNAVVTDLKG